MSYRLDDLGWFQFEELIQSLLKSFFNAPIEAWGGTHDFGRDAYYENPIVFPDAMTAAPGPILFQCKFVNEANAARSDPRPALRAAINADVRRKTTRRVSVVPPSTYVLFTNAPLSASLRIELVESIKQQHNLESVYVYGSQDISTWLNGLPNLRQSFPQLLSLRDLRFLIERATSKASVERSRISLEQAFDLSKIFVPTEACSLAWKTLRQHHFAVLEGPPEVGKTALARIIAFTQYSLGWEAFECNNPDDFFRLLNPKSPQIFIADDAFGSTEYDPTLSAQWGRDLDKILHALDGTHWFLWTARKHILEMAIQRLHLQGAANRFPLPGNVLVDVSNFTRVEKALILYRHAKHAALSEEAKDVVRSMAKTVINNKNFTPERIRRLIGDRLPSLIKSNTDAKVPLIFQQAVDRELDEPTDAMKKSFRGLSKDHQFFLISLLDQDKKFSYLETFQDRAENAFNRHREIGSTKTFDEIARDLDHTFIRTDLGPSGDAEWVHPSWRDFVIGEVASKVDWRRRFIKRTSFAGIRLALSQGGGDAGTRIFPLLVDPEDWIVLSDRILEIVTMSSNQDDLSRLFDILLEGLQIIGKLKKDKALNNLVTNVLESCVAKWNIERAVLENPTLKKFHKLSELCSKWIVAPNLTVTFNSLFYTCQEYLNDHNSNDPFEPHCFLQLATFVEICADLEPRFLKYVNWPECFKEQSELLGAGISDYIDWIEKLDRGVDLGSELNDAVTAFELLEETIGTAVFADDLRYSVSQLGEVVDTLKDDQIQFADPPDRDDYDGPSGSQIEPDQIEHIFDDL